MKWKTYSIPAPGEPGSETWKDKNNAWQTGGGAFYVHRLLRSATNLTYWGSGNPVPGYDAQRRPGDNLYTSSAIAFDAANGKISWWHQYTPNDNRDYDETGTHILIDTKVNGEDRKIVSHAGRNGFNYTFDRGNGQFLKAAQYVKEVTWTKGIDPKTGKPVDYDPSKDFQIYAEGPEVNADKRARRVCPDTAGGNNYWPASYSQKTRLIYIPANEGCATVTPDYAAHVSGNFAGGTTTDAGRITSSVVAVDPATGEVKMRTELPYPNFAGVLSTAGGIVITALLDGTIVALDDQTLEELWRVNVGTGFNAPPMTYSVNGKQYIAIASGLYPQRQEQALARARDEEPLERDDDLRVRVVVHRCSRPILRDANQSARSTDRIRRQNVELREAHSDLILRQRSGRRLPTGTRLEGWRLPVSGRPHVYPAGAPTAATILGRPVWT